MTSSPARRGGLYVAFVREPDDRGTKARRRTVRRVRQHFDNDSPGHANLEAKVEPTRVVVVVVGDLQVLLDPLPGQIVRSCGAQAHGDEEDAEEDGEGLEPGNLELMNAPLGFNPDDPNQEIDEAMMVDYLERNCLAWDELVPHSAPCSTTPTFDMLPMPWLLVETAALPSQTALGVDRFSLPENPVIIQGVDISASDGAVPNSALIQVNHSNLQIANLTLVC